jgi:F-type H+-transporting ATPase subunit delta
MIIRPEQYARAFFDALKEVPVEKQRETLKNFANRIIDDRMYTKYEEIEAELKRLFLEDEGKAEAKITTAREMTPDREMLAQVGEIAGKEIVPMMRVDESIIGGMVVKAGDILIDASIKRQLNDLHQKLRN